MRPRTFRTGFKENPFRFARCAGFCQVKNISASELPVRIVLHVPVRLHAVTKRKPAGVFFAQNLNHVFVPGTYLKVGDLVQVVGRRDHDQVEPGQRQQR